MDLSPQRVENGLERVVEGHSSPRLLALHRRRYEMAMRFVGAEDLVVDCACGSGFGCGILARRARLVLGLDISPLAAAYGRRFHAAPNVRFLAAAAERLPLAGESAGAVCSFETLEHLEDAGRFLREAARVLKPGGRLIFSTPNRLAFSEHPGGGPLNPHHRREWTLRELDALIGERFAWRRYYGQAIHGAGRRSWMYWRSRVKRLLGLPDFTPLPPHPGILSHLDQAGGWLPRYFWGVAWNSKPVISIS